MHLLDDDRRISRIDPDNIFKAVRLLPNQAEEVWRLSQKFSFSATGTIDRVVVVGMGGSALGPHIVRSVYRDALQVPVEIVNGYRLPGGVGPRTLVILSSYSGTTEEVLSAAKEAHQRKVKLVGLCAGGPLATLLKKFHAPILVFTPTANPGNRPRMGLGYMIFGMLGIFSKTKLLSSLERDVASACMALRRAQKRYDVDVPFSSNPAKKMAMLLKDTIPFYIAAEHLEGSVHALTNQTNETGKQFASWFALPELNHHLMEGLKHPPLGIRRLMAVFFSSSLYRPRIQKRLTLTEEVVKKNGVEICQWHSSERTKLGQAAEMLVFGGALTYYLGILHGENPAPTPWVDYFKERLT